MLPMFLHTGKNKKKEGKKKRLTDAFDKFMSVLMDKSYFCPSTEVKYSTCTQ